MQKTYDLVIRGGTLADGTGAPAREADVAVKDGRIAAVGEVQGRGTEEVDRLDQRPLVVVADLGDDVGVTVVRDALAVDDELSHLPGDGTERV